MSVDDPGSTTCWHVPGLLPVSDELVVFVDPGVSQKGLGPSKQELGPPLRRRSCGTRIPLSLISAWISRIGGR